MARVLPLAQRRPAVTVLVAAVVIALIGAGASAWSGFCPRSRALFDGEAGLPAVLASESAAAIAIVTIARMITYGIALSAGFRGGPIFPSMSLGVGIGASLSLFLDPSMETPWWWRPSLPASASLKLPFTAGLLALLITSSAGVVTAPVAIVGAVVGYVLRIAHDKKWPPRSSPPPRPQPLPLLPDSIPADLSGLPYPRPRGEWREARIEAKAASDPHPGHKPT